MNQAIISRPPTAPVQTDTNADTGKKKVPCPGTDRQIPSTGKGRTRTHLHTAGPDTGDKQSS